MPPELASSVNQSTEQHTVAGTGTEGGEHGTPAVGAQEPQIVTPAIVNHFIREGSPFVTIMLTPGVEISKCIYLFFFGVFGGCTAGQQVERSILHQRHDL